jgi:hypothetical protein
LIAVNSSYHPKWLRLDEAAAQLERSLSVSEQAAKDWLLRAIQDQLRADAKRYKAQTMFRVAGFPTQWKHRGKPDWPARLTPDRIDWDRSTIHGQDPVRIIDNDLLIEVSAAALSAGAAPSAAQHRNRNSPKRAAAEAAVKACYPERVPSQPDLPNGQLCAELSAWLKIHRPKITMDDKTILRAAGRVS